MSNIFSILNFILHENWKQIKNIAYLFDQNQLDRRTIIQLLFSFILFWYEAIWYIILELIHPEVYQIDFQNNIWISLKQGFYKISFILFAIGEIFLCFPMGYFLYQAQIHGHFKDYGLFTNNFLRAVNPTEGIDGPIQDKHIFYFINRANYNAIDRVLYCMIIFIFQMHLKVYKQENKFEFRYIDLEEISNNLINSVKIPYNNFDPISTQILNFFIKPLYVDSSAICSLELKKELTNIAVDAFKNNPQKNVSFIGYELGGPIATIIIDVFLNNPEYHQYAEKIKNMFYVASTIFIYSDFNLPKNDINYYQIFGINDYSTHFALDKITPAPLLNGNLQVVPINYWNVALVQYISMFTIPDIYQYIINNCK